MRSPWRRHAIALIGFACAPVLAHAQSPGRLQEDFLAPLMRASCPQGVERTQADPVDLRVARIPLQGVNPARKTIGELTFVGGFHLTSTDPRFGGLSGIGVLDDGNLLAVSDAGSFVWIGLAADGVTPVSAQIAGMRDAAGDLFRSKSGADAEGLALVGEVALVSFEGDHRVLAYDLGACGATARGVRVGAEGRFAEGFAQQGMKVGGNEGVEALAVTSDWFLVAGVEAKAGSASAVSARAIEAAPTFDIRLGEGVPGLVGLDIIADEAGGRGFTAFSLHRSTNAMATEVIALVETVFVRELDQASLPARIISEIDERSRERFRPVVSRKLASMNLFVTIDNFEGVAAQRMPDGRVRLFVIADDNFSAKQRTLLMVYDVAERG